MKMRWRVSRGQIDCGLELGNRSFNVPKTQKPFSGVSIESCGLQAGFVLTDLRSQNSLPGSALFIPQLMQDCRESGMRSGEIGLQANGFPQRRDGFLQFYLLL